MKKLVNVLLSITILLAFAACKLGTGAYDVEDPKTPASKSGSSGNSNSGNGGGSSGGNSGGNNPPAPTGPANIANADWLDETTHNLKIGNEVIDKTSEVIIIPSGKTAEINMTTSNPSWGSYLLSGAENNLKGVFVGDRNVKLDSYVMDQYVVTEQLYAKIMGETATDSIKPKTSVSWYQACAFCNELTMQTMSESDCVYYKDADCKNVYTKSDGESNRAVYIAYSNHKWAKKGYRLPTEAEWEFAARGGNPDAPEWKYAFAGVQSSHNPINDSKTVDTPFDDYGWYKNNSNNTLCEVGQKEKNSLNLYDMSGNVNEWCYDYVNMGATTSNLVRNNPAENDSKYKIGDSVVNPLGLEKVVYATTGSYNITRGGTYNSNPLFCTVSYRSYNQTTKKTTNLGFRVCRSTE